MSPVTSFRGSSTPSAAAPAATVTSTPVAAPVGPVGHGTVRLLTRPPAYQAASTPSPPPPTQETAGVGHGRIRLRV